MFCELQQTMINVKLTQADEVIAARVGLARAETAKVKGYAHRFPSISPKTYFDEIINHVNGAAAEIAIAKALGLSDFMPTIDSFKHHADIGKQFECKWTSYQSGHLIIGAHDREDDIAILCVGTAPDLRVIGYMPVIDAKKARFKHDKTQSWWVSQINLRPIENLSRSIHAVISV
jgi:hypothetical protein